MKVNRKMQREMTVDLHTGHKHEKTVNESHSENNDTWGTGESDVTNKGHLFGSVSDRNPRLGGIANGDFNNKVINFICLFMVLVKLVLLVGVSNFRHTHSRTQNVAALLLAFVRTTGFLRFNQRVFYLPISIDTPLTSASTYWTSLPIRPIHTNRQTRARNQY